MGQFLALFTQSKNLCILQDGRLVNCAYTKNSAVQERLHFFYFFICFFEMWQMISHCNLTVIEPELSLRFVEGAKRKVEISPLELSTCVLSEDEHI